MVNVNRHFLKVALVVLVAILIVTLILQGTCLASLYININFFNCLLWTIYHVAFIVLSCDIYYTFTEISNNTTDEVVNKVYTIIEI